MAKLLLTKEQIGRCLLCGRRWKLSLFSPKQSTINQASSGLSFLTLEQQSDIIPSETTYKHYGTFLRVRKTPERNTLVGIFYKNQSFLSPTTSLRTCNVRHVSTEPSTFYERMLASDQIHFFQTTLENFHDLTGLPWGGTIVISALCLRFILTFPVAVFTEFNHAKVDSLQPIILGRAKYAFYHQFAMRVKNEKWPPKKIEKVFTHVLKQQARKMYVEKNCHPMKSTVLFFVQIPLFVGLSMALRNMTGAFSGKVFTDPTLVVPSMSTESFLWLTDLTAADPYLILPILVGTVNLINIELRTLREGKVSRGQRLMTNFFRGFSLLMIPIAAYMPSAIPLYWASSALYGTAQNIAFKAPSVRRTLGIPKTDADSETPFTDMKKVFVKRYFSRKDKNDTTLPSIDIEEYERRENAKQKETGGKSRR